MITNFLLTKLYTKGLFIGLLGLILVSCNPSSKVSIKNFGTVAPSGTCETGKGIGVAVEADNPDNLPLTYNWITDESRVRVASASAPAGTYECPDTPGIRTITVEVRSEGAVLDQQTIQIEVIGTVASVPDPAPTSPPVEAAVILTPESTHTPTPEPPTATPTATDTPAPTATPTPTCDLTSGRPPIVGNITDIQAVILYPLSCSQDLPVGGGGSANGTYEGNLEGREIWLLVWPSRDQKYYPQSPDECKELPANAAGGEWGTLLGYGGPAQTYDVVVTVTDIGSEASMEIKRWLKNGCDTRDFPGYALPELPAGLTELTAITVATSE